MATILKNILQFSNLVIGVPVALPHGLNLNDIPVAPHFGAANAPGLTVAADDATVTVTRGATGPSAVQVYVEHWHTIEAVLPLPGELAGFVPFFVSSGVGAAGESVFDNFVFRPGGVAGGNVYTDWAALVAAKSLVQGFKTIQIDDSISPAVIPAGDWDMSQTEICAFVSDKHIPPGQLVNVSTAAAAVTMPNFKKLGGPIIFTNLSTVPLITSPSTGYFFEVSRGHAGSDGPPQILNNGPAPFIDATALTVTPLGLAALAVLRISGVIGGTGAPFIQLPNEPGLVMPTTRLVLGLLDQGSILGDRISGGGSPLQLLVPSEFTASSLLANQDSYTGFIARGVYAAGVNRVNVYPSAPQAAFVAALTNPSAGFGMNTLWRMNGTFIQKLPLIRAASIAPGAPMTVPGVINSQGLTVTVKNEGVGVITVEPASAGIATTLAAGGDGFTQAAGNTTLTIAAAPFTAAMIGLPITIAGATSVGNNVTATIAAVGGGGTTVTYANATGVTEGAVAAVTSYAVGTVAANSISGVVGGGFTVPAGAAATFTSDGASDWKVTSDAMGTPSAAYNAAGVAATDRILADGDGLADVISVLGTVIKDLQARKILG